MAVIVAWLTFRLVNKTSLDGYDPIPVANLVEEIFAFAWLSYGPLLPFVYLLVGLLYV